MNKIQYAILSFGMFMLKQLSLEHTDMIADSKKEVIAKRRSEQKEIQKRNSKMVLEKLHKDQEANAQALRQKKYETLLFQKKLAKR